MFGQNVGAALNKLIVGTEMLVALPPAEAKNVEEVRCQRGLRSDAPSWRKPSNEQSDSMKMFW